MKLSGLKAAVVCVSLQGCSSLSSLPVSAKQIDAPDLIVHNARILTMDDSTAGGAMQKSPTALVVTGGNITAVGDETLLSRKSSGTRVVDAGGRLVTPGLHDSHVHLAEGSLESLQLDLSTCTRADDVKTALINWRKKYPRHREIVGNGLPLPAVQGLDLKALDEAISGVPVVLYAADGHSAWLNTPALDLARKYRPALVENAKLAKDDGILREMDLVVLSRVITKKDLSQTARRQALLETIRQANSFGITTIQDAHATPDVVAAYEDLAKLGKLDMRVNLALHIDLDELAKDPSPARLELELKKMKSVRARINGPGQKRKYERLRVVAAKIFVDGVIETGTAAVLEPYIGRLADKANGKPNLDVAGLTRLTTALVSSDFAVHMHAIGDAAVRMALDSLSPLVKISKSRDLRHQIAHLELVDKEDLKRFDELGVTADLQSYWAFRDPYVVDLTIPVLGEERSARLYPFGDLRNAGARLAAGSDWTVSTLNPLDAMQVAVTRQSLSQDKDALNPEQCLPLSTILAAYTTGGAHVNYGEARLTAGAPADFVIFDQDFTRCPPGDIHRTRVRSTYLAGSEVWHAK